MRKLDNEIRLAGFRGYEGCEHLRTDTRGCPTPSMCSEKGSCVREGIVRRGPQRVQLRRVKGWRKMAGAIVVARPTKWGNPNRVVKCEGGWLVQHDFGASIGTFPEKVEANRVAVNAYRAQIVSGSNIAVPSVDEIKQALAGYDLACWCHPSMPCHADVLLEIANG